MGFLPFEERQAAVFIVPTQTEHSPCRMGSSFKRRIIGGRAVDQMGKVYSALVFAPSWSAEYERLGYVGRMVRRFEIECKPYHPF